MIEIWTDGACEPNPGTGGWGWHLRDGHDNYRASDFGGEVNTTNNRMEMTAILEALKALPDGETAIVFSDSQYCIKGLTIWSKKWAKNNWKKKGKPMINQDLWLALEEQKNRVFAKFQWVRGHNGNKGNEHADELANAGRYKITPKRNFSGWPAYCSDTAH